MTADKMVKARLSFAKQLASSPLSEDETAWTVRVRNTFLEATETRDARARPTSAPPRLHAPRGAAREAGPDVAPVAPGPLSLGERRTTVVVRAVPHALTRAMLLQVLDREGLASKYDFVYLPIDFHKGTNFGYAFVDFVDSQWSQRFMHQFHGFTNWGIPHKVQSNVVWSTLQSLEPHVERYRNSPVMHPSVADECKPIILRDGQRLEFPQPTAPIPAIRRLRTQRGSVKQLRWDKNAEGRPCLNQAADGCIPKLPDCIMAPELPNSKFFHDGCVPNAYGSEDGSSTCSGGTTPSPCTPCELPSRRHDSYPQALSFDAPSRGPKGALLLAPLLATPRRVCRGKTHSNRS